MVVKVDWKISLMKGIKSIVIVFISVLIAGLTAEPELVPVYSGVLIAALNWIKHFFIQEGIMNG